MTPKEAAAEFWATIDVVRDTKPVLARHEKASKVLKEHMADKGIDTFLGIHMTETNGGRRLDQGKALAKFGDKLNDCFVDSIRRALIPVKRPKSLDPAA
ncbi:MAG TPA: hypothetical protein VFH54_06075 [Mycobacteriales bacterium]|nr:hypothetical protein [Mycobacteriales bacterium]